MIAKKIDESHAIFQDILSATDIDPLEKYSHFYNSINPNELASAAQAKAFVPIITDRLKGAYPAPSLVVVPSGMQTVKANSFPLEDILADGFPTDKKIHLFLYFEGPKTEDEDQFAGDDKIINVALAVRKFFGIKDIHANPDGLIGDIKG